MMAKRPLPSVTALRVFSISTGLEASTVTPGITAPLVSRTTPTMLAASWAARLEAAPKAAQRTNTACITERRIASSWLSYTGDLGKGVRTGLIVRPDIGKVNGLFTLF